MHIAQQVGGGIGIHLLHDVGGTVGVERGENRNLHLGIDLLQGFGGDLIVESLEDGFALGGRQVFHDVGDVGGVQFGQAIERNLQPDAAGRIDLDEVNELPRNHSRRNLGEKQLQCRCRNHAFQQPADRSARAHVDRAKLEHNVVMAKLLVDVNVIDPHNLAPVDVNDLLVEQVALQQQHAFPAGVRAPLRSGGSNPQAAIDQAE